MTCFASDRTVEIRPSRLSGTVAAPPSKSVAHREFICAGLCGGGPVPAGREEALSEDLAATLRCLRALGGGAAREDGHWMVLPVGRGPGLGDGACRMRCGESGTTLRLLLPVAAALGRDAVFEGEGRLPERPLGELCRVLREHGAELSGDRLPLRCRGRLAAGRYVVPGDVSSQYVSGLLLALPLLEGDSELLLSTPLESGSYVRLTLSVMKRFGVGARAVPGGWRIPGGQAYVAPAGGIAGEGDWSNAAVFLAAGAIAGPLSVSGLDPDSGQGDRAVLEILRRFGASVRVDRPGGLVTVSPGALGGCDVDLRETPDLLPALAVVAAAASGRTRFRNAARLRLKECDRLAGVAGMIRRLGGACRELPDSLEVEGGVLSGGTVDIRNDHRLAMAAALAALACAGPVRFSGAAAVRKSYPGFFRDYREAGGIVHVV